MGIPSYFTHIIRKYPRIITPFQHLVYNFYLDSNSIIYDVVASMDKNTVEFERVLIQLVCQKIDHYLTMVKPKRVIIAFDGVPPMAKIKQQRERRYKGLITQKMMGESSGWNTIQITPGTTFMKQLNQGLQKHFKDYDQQFDFFKLSTSEECGEGEHKIFEHIRAFPEHHEHRETLVYGLDSDLIVLSLHHLQYGNIRLLREAPAFMVDSKDPQVLEVSILAQGIQSIVPNLHDYVLLTLFLGNDFMPHFPALNLRSNGMETLLKCYQQLKLPLFNGQIIWTNLRKFVELVSTYEKEAITKDFLFRKRFIPDTSTLEKQVNNIPMIQMGTELYIEPTKPGWEKRYYEKLCPQEISTVCSHFIHMLEWNMMYYTTGCPNWTIYYPLSYPPLLGDLKHYIPEMSTLEYNDTKWTETQLLHFVLPSSYHRFIEGGVDTETQIPQLEWSYCRYLWESHVLFV
jgi:5'-3' exonuclease